MSDEGLVALIAAKIWLEEHVSKPDQTTVGFAQNNLGDDAFRVVSAVFVLEDECDMSIGAGDSVQSLLTAIDRLVSQTAAAA